MESLMIITGIILQTIQAHTWELRRWGDDYKRTWNEVTEIAEEHRSLRQDILNFRVNLCSLDEARQLMMVCVCYIVLVMRADEWQLYQGGSWGMQSVTLCTLYFIDKISLYWGTFTRQRCSKNENVFSLYRWQHCQSDPHSHLSTKTTTLFMPGQ